MAKQTKYESGAKVTRQVLNHQVDSDVQRDLERTSDVNRPGILVDVLNEMNLVAGANTTAPSPTITVRTGMAYNASGERIVIDSETITYNSAAPTTTTADGLGGFTLTPQSTGSKNISLATNTTNYIWVDYLQLLDPASFTLHKVTNKKLFYRAQDGYQLGANTSSVTPPSGFSVASFVLGLVVTNTTLTGGIDTISTTLKPRFGTKAHRVEVKVPEANRSDATSTYASGSTVFVDSHVQAVGTGSVTPTNPHGLTAIDIGINDPGGATHQKTMHTDGIISTSISGNASALFMQEHTSGVASQNYVEVFPLVAGEYAAVNGVTFSHTDIPSSVTFHFIDNLGASLPNGTHVIYLDSTTRILARALPGTFNISDPTLRKIWEIDWTSPTINAGSKVDRRVFGTLNNNNMRFELLGGLVNGLATGNRGTSLTYDNLNDDRITSATISGDNGTISGVDTTVTFTYDAPAPVGKLVSTTSSYGNRTLTTTYTYTGDLVTNVTETIT